MFCVMPLLKQVASPAGMRILRILLVWLITLPLCAPLFGIEQDRRVDQLLHASWIAKDGAPGEVQALAQTTDGYLWLGTATGLFHFDGVRFQRYEPQGGQHLLRRNVTALLAVPEGGLWVGFATGGASFVKNGHVTNYGEQEGLPRNNLRAFARDQGGVIWAASGAGGLARLEGSHWKKIEEDWNFSGTAASVFVDHKGTLWTGTRGAIVSLSNGGNRFQSAGGDLKTVMSIGESPDHTLWIAEVERSVRPLFHRRRGANVPQPEIVVGSQAILFDKQGSLWITTLGDGIRRMAYPERLGGAQITKFSEAAQIFTQKDGLTGDYVECILEDREGNIWIGTNRGLDRFRQSPVVPVHFPPGASQFTLFVQDDGSILAGTLNQNVFRIQDGKVAGHLDFALMLGHRDPGGALWMTSPDKDATPALFRFADRRLHPIEAPPGPALGNAKAITTDLSGRLWISADNGVFRLERDRWRSLESLGGPSGTAAAAFTDASGRTWFGFSDNEVVLVDGDNVRILSAKDGINVGGGVSIEGQGTEVWIGGELGAAWFDGSRFRPIVSADEVSFSGIYGLIVTADNGLWLSENRGIVQIPEAELRAFKRDPSRRVNYYAFGLLDGLSANLQRSTLSPSVVEGADGRLWFATTDGVVWIDPKHVMTNAAPPPVSIESVMANGRNYTSLERLELPAQTTNIQIAYTALSLSIPERVRFRYILEGQDENWQDVGPRRRAFYTNLGPGSYQFRVIACNDDGVWNEAGATATFIIAPAWYQTTWFGLLCVVSSAVAIWLMYRLRVRQISASISARFDERLAERTRVAQDLHDTLLQTIQGSKMVADNALDSPTDPERMRRAMERLSNWLGYAMQEGRAALNSLRASVMQRNDLAEALQQAIEDCLIHGSMEVAFSVVGDAKEMHPIVRDEIYRIGYEAIRNACMHSGGNRLEVELTYARDLTLSVRDNGKGIDPVIAAQGRERHFGLQGMRERTARIGGEFTLVTSSKSGTEMRFVVPGSIIFRRSGPFRERRVRASSP